MPETARRTPPIVAALWIIGWAEIAVGLFSLLINFLIYTDNPESVSSITISLAVGVIICGVLFLAIAFIANKLDQIEQHLRTLAGVVSE